MKLKQIDSSPTVNVAFRCFLHTRRTLPFGSERPRLRVSPKHKRQRCSGSLIITSASTDEVEPLRFGPGAIRELPIFPLGVVAFPTVDTPLNIFEARYRVLFNTLLAGSDGIDEGLVNEEKPWAGTRLFGLCFVNGEGKMAAVGCTLHISRHVTASDGRMMVVNRGVEKFVVLKVLEQRPVMVCQVEILEDDDRRGGEAASLAKETSEAFSEFLDLHVKVNQVSRSPDLLPTKEGMSPRELSYTLALVFSQNTYAAQALLEEQSVKARLLYEKEMLQSFAKVLSAKAAVQSAFSTESSEETKPESSQEPPPEQKQDG